MLLTKKFLAFLIAVLAMSGFRVVHFMELDSDKKVNAVLALCGIAYHGDTPERSTIVTSLSAREADYRYDARWLVMTIKWENAQVDGCNDTDNGRLTWVARVCVDEKRTCIVGTSFAPKATTQLPAPGITSITKTNRSAA